MDAFDPALLHLQPMSGLERRAKTSLELPRKEDTVLFLQVGEKLGCRPHMELACQLISPPWRAEAPLHWPSQGQKRTSKELQLCELCPEGLQGVDAAVIWLYAFKNVLTGRHDGSLQHYPVGGLCFSDSFRFLLTRLMKFGNIKTMIHIALGERILSMLPPPTRQLMEQYEYHTYKKPFIFWPPGWKAGTTARVWLGSSKSGNT